MRDWSKLKELKINVRSLCVSCLNSADADGLLCAKCIRGHMSALAAQIPCDDAQRKHDVPDRLALNFIVKKEAG